MDYHNFRIYNPQGLKVRSYVSFYLGGKRIREYNGNNLCLPIHPNRAKTAKEKSRLLKRLMLELIKAVKEENYPVISAQPLLRAEKVIKEKSVLFQTQALLDSAIERKLNANLVIHRC